MINGVKWIQKQRTNEIRAFSIKRHQLKIIIVFNLIAYNNRKFKKMGFNFLYSVQPLTKLMPTILKQQIPLTIHQKTIYTAIALFIYLICSQIPLFGIERSYASDPFYWTRVILASSRGTLMELGISPIISAGWMIQIVQAVGFLRPNSQHDEKTLEGLEKALAMIFCFGQAVGNIWYGSYGNSSTMSFTTMFLIVAQLLMAGLVVIMLDELLKKGYGLGAGISLFIVANTSQIIFWQMFSPVTLSSQYGVEFEGCFICLVHFIMTKPSTSNAIYQAFTRVNNPNLSMFCGTVFIFFIIIYLQGFKVRIPLIHQKHRGYTTEIKVKLFYTSNMSVILQSMLVSNFYNISAILYSRFSKSILVKFFGVWENGKVTNGLMWYISPPTNWADFFLSPVRTVTYLTFVCLSCAFFARIWIEITKQTPKQIAKQIRAQELTLPSYRTDSVYSVLNKYIPTAAMLGGIVIGLLTVLGDLVNAMGSTTGILLSVSILYGYYEKLALKKNHDIEY